jgi:hypothetical protein
MDGPSAIRIPPAMSAPLKLPTNSDTAFILKPGAEAGSGPRPISSLAMEPSGSGISPIGISPTPCRSSISIMPGNTCGIWLHSIHTMRRRSDAGWCP